MKNNSGSEQISGVIENVVYYNDGNDYSVIEIIDSDGLLVTAVGTIPIPSEGEHVILFGKWVYHKEFGKQFSVESFEKTLPEGTEDIYKYLSSQTVKGIGPKTARKIVDRFGVDTFDVIENHPEWLADISGITLKKAAIISKSFREQNGLRGVIMFCKDYMDVGEATRVYKRLGAGAVGLILENPYILCAGEGSLPFKHVDEIAASIGFDMKSDFRIFSGFVYELDYAARVNGHTCLPKEQLISSASKTLCLDMDYVSLKLSEYIAAEKLAHYVAGDTEYVMTVQIDESENYVAKRLVEMDNAIVRYGADDVASLINKVECYTGIQYAALQKKAIAEALSGGVMVLTGGPGTGKTTVVKALISIFESMGLKCVLAAPTGRAANRMSEATGEEAKTIHRMLEMERGNDKNIRFGRGPGNPLDENVIIIDEVSMVDTLLMYSLLRAVRKGSRLILIGDANQLPSVGAGNVLSDLILSERIRTVELNEIFRQSKESLIVTNAHRINRGERPDLSSTSGDFFFVRRENEYEIAETVANLITNRLPKAYGHEFASKVQTITPSRIGPGGVTELNLVLQARLNPPAKYKAERTCHGFIFREGDRVMQTVNNYDIEWTRGNEVGMGVFNGDIGIIQSIDNHEGCIVVVFDDKEVTYTLEYIDELELAYAITVHKSQGSEYPLVIIPVYSCPPMLLSRNLLYTAITRAKQMVVMVGRSDIVSRMIDNNREIKRYTTLKERIISYS